VAPAGVIATPAATPETEKWYENINPLYLGGAALAVLLTALLGFMMRGKRRRQGLSSFEDSIMTGSDLKASTIYGTQGGTAVNTNNTSFLTDFSQAGLGTIDTHEVDPIAEAEVYMAYGRDAQAEEILKEALTKDPARHEIHLKLLEIYANRKNLPAFESVATELYAALGGEMTPLWAKATDLGRKLDPNNPLYAETAGANSAAASHVATAADSQHAAAASVVAAAGMATVALASRRQSDVPVHDAKLDAPVADPLDHALDFSSAASFGQPNFNEELNPQGIIVEAVEKHTVQDDSIFHDLDTLMAESNTKSGFASFDALASHEKLMTTEPVPKMAVEPADDGLDFDFDFPEAAPSMAASSTAPMLDFSDISLDLNDIGDMGDTHAGADIHGEHTASWHEVTTKLDLARVYHEMGDTDNAREILHEVVQEGDADQKADAQALLDQLG
jgi:pilus assembly protein FimV